MGDVWVCRYERDSAKVFQTANATFWIGTRQLPTPDFNAPATAWSCVQVAAGLPASERVAGTVLSVSVSSPVSIGFIAVR